MSEKQKYRKTGLYRKPENQLSDGRTQQQRLIRDLRLSLVQYIGNSAPTVAQEILIQRIIFKHIRLSSYESTALNNTPNEEAQHYVPWSNSLRRDLETLALLASPDASKPDLKSYIETFSNKKGE
jgi:hypothetical protein